MNIAGAKNFFELSSILKVSTFLKKFSVGSTLSLQTHHIYSTFKQRGNDGFHGVST